MITLGCCANAWVDITKNKTNVLQMNDLTILRLHLILYFKSINLLLYFRFNTFFTLVLGPLSLLC